MKGGKLMEKEKYVSPEIQIIEFETEDVITTSIEGGDVTP